MAPKVLRLRSMGLDCPNTMGQYPSNKPIIYTMSIRAKVGIILSYYHISRQLSPLLDGYDGHF